MDIQPISMELSENMKKFIEFNEYACKEWNKFILSQCIPKEREGQQELFQIQQKDYCQINDITINTYSNNT